MEGGIFWKKLDKNCYKREVEGRKNLRNQLTWKVGKKINKPDFLFIREMRVPKSQEEFCCENCC